MATQTLEQKFNDIVGLYDLADELINEVDTAFTPFKSAHYELVGELIDEVTSAADVLCESYTEIAHTKGKVKQSSKNRVEGALRKVFVAIEDYKKRAERLAPKLVADAVERTTKIVERIRESAGHIVAIFITCVDLSVDRIMQKSEVDELRRKEVDVAFALDQLAKSH